MIGTNIYSGYLDTATSGRRIHYVFIEANVTDPTNASLAVWLNGGPGCSSLCGMIQEIGPYLVGDSYKLGDMLTKNDYSWNKVANLLFLESPAAVGFSSDDDLNYPWTDQETARDAFSAIKDFIFNKASEFANRPLFVPPLPLRFRARATRGSTFRTSRT
jgi:carboxypeptidase C (cathepsin A)